MTALYYALATLTALIPYWIWGWMGLVVVALIGLAFHVGYRVGKGEWMKPL